MLQQDAIWGANLQGVLESSRDVPEEREKTSLLMQKKKMMMMMDDVRVRVYEHEREILFVLL